MKIVVIGGTGLIGSKTVERLRKRGHDVLAASPNSGVNTMTGEGLAGALAGCRGRARSRQFSVFRRQGRAGVLPDRGPQPACGGEGRRRRTPHRALRGRHRAPAGKRLLRGKLVQEKLIRQSGIPYTIVHSTQFMEFLGGIAQSGTVGQTVQLSPAFVQPISSDDVADVMADVALAAPANGTIEIAGPERVRLTELVARYLKATDDPRIVKADPEARYFGARLDDRSLVSDDNPRLGSITFEQWFAEPRRRKRLPSPNDPPLIPRRHRSPRAFRIAITRRSTRMNRALFGALALVAIAAGSASAHDTNSASKVTLVYQHELPNVPGKSIKGVLVEYGPGGFSAAHTHPTSAFIYATVLEGAIRSQVNDGPGQGVPRGRELLGVPG